MTVSEIDVLSPDSYVPSFPHGLLEELRRRPGLYFHPEPDGPGFWAVTRYHDVLTAARDAETFSSWRGTVLIADRTPEQLEVERFMLLNMDPPEHTKLRGIIQRAFTPRRIRSLEPRVAELCREIVDRALTEQEVDFVPKVAAELPVAVIAEFLGLPSSDHERIYHWSDQMVGFDDPEIRPTPEEGERAQMELYAYANELAEDRRKNPGDDVVSALVTTEVDGEVLDGFRFAMFFIQLLVAGNETTRNAMSGGVLGFIEHPAAWERLRDEPALITPAVEEVLRYTSPVIQFRRTATRDTELAGQPIAEGDKVVVFFSSANFDQDVFADPYRLDVARDPNPHIAFGAGHHFCLGASLARLELKVMLSELAQRVRGFELTGDVRRLRSNLINGIKSMPVRLHPA